MLILRAQAAASLRRIRKGCAPEQGFTRLRHTGAARVAGQAVASPRQIREGCVPGQASVELLEVLGVALLAILFVAVFASDMLADNQHQAEMRQARLTVQKLADAADYVYAQGAGATSAVRVDLPPSADYDPEKTFIGKPASAPGTASPNAINIHIYDSDVTAYSLAPLAGAFPANAGAHIINVTSQGGLVSIGGPLATLSQSSIFLAMKKGETRVAYANFQAVYSQPIVLNATYAWPYSNPSLDIQSPIMVAQQGPAQIALAFTTDSTHSGTYTGLLTVSAYPSGAPTQQMETYAMPITVEVQ